MRCEKMSRERLWLVPGCRDRIASHLDEVNLSTVHIIAGTRLGTWQPAVSEGKGWDGPDHQTKRHAVSAIDRRAVSSNMCLSRSTRW